MSVSYIPDKTKFALWAQAAGRCQYDGCNKILWHDLITKKRFSTAYIAHIIADKPKGPRGHPVLSEKLKSELSNLMLLCDTHHRLIDKEDISGHPVDRLHNMKAKHEARIRTQTSLQQNKQSHVVHYTANVGNLKPKISWDQSHQAMAPDWFPAEDRTIDISLKNSAFLDKDEEFWKFERKNLHRQFVDKVRDRIPTEIDHISVFALAPQPLLIELGRLLSDISAVTVYQHQKEPEDNWQWHETGEVLDFKLKRPSKECDLVALNLSLSATIVNDRIKAVLGNDVAIWTITIDTPHNDFLKTKEQLSTFRQTLRRAFDEIKAIHGQQTQLHIFPAVPVSIAVEVGRVWMPKADLPLKLYDQNRSRGGFQHAFDINSLQEPL